MPLFRSVKITNAVLDCSSLVSTRVKKELGVTTGSFGFESLVPSELNGSFSLRTGASDFVTAVDICAEGKRVFSDEGGDSLHRYLGQ